MAGKRRQIGVGMLPCQTEFGALLRTHRIKQGFTQRRLAKVLGMEQSSYSNFETGINRYFDQKKVRKLSRVLKISRKLLRATIPLRANIQSRTKLGMIIISNRMRLGMSQNDFAKKLKISFSSLSKLESGNRRHLGYQLALRLAHSLGWDVKVLAKYIGYSGKKAKCVLGETMRSRRKELGLSLSDLAKKLNVKRQFLSQIELGKCPLNQNKKMVDQIAKELKLNAVKLRRLITKRKLKKNVIDLNTIGGFLTVRRLELGLTQNDVDSLVDRYRYRDKIFEIESGKCYPHPETLIVMERALKCEIPEKFWQPPIVK